MSIGRLVRFVKKWLKRDNDCGLYEEEEDEEDEEEEEEGQQGLQMTAEPCVSCGRDLNRNIHISSSSSSSSSSHRKMGLTDKSGDYCCYYYELPESASSSLYPPPGPFHHCTARAVPFASSSSSSAPSGRSSRSPVPVCVCDACCLFASPNLQPVMSASSRRRTAVVAPASAPASGRRSFVDEGSERWSCPSRIRVDDASSRLVPGRFVASKPGDASTETASRIGCIEDGSHLQTSTARQTTHSASVAKRLGADDTVAAEDHHLLEDQTTGQNPADHLPVSVALSFDGEEGYTSAQRRLHCWNQRYSDARVQWRFCPPPNKTICHVAK